MFAPACLSHEVITRRYVLKLPCDVWKTSFHSLADGALFCCVPATGSTCRWKAPLCPERCTAGTAASTTAGTTRRRPGPAPCTWSTTAPGLTATPPVPPSETSSQGRRWTSSSSSCTWALTCRRWPSSRAWTRASYWACSAAAAKQGTHAHAKLSRAGHWSVSHNWYLHHTPHPLLPVVRSPLTSVCPHVSVWSHNLFPLKTAWQGTTFCYSLWGKKSFVL